jgi:hypothetical protein
MELIMARQTKILIILISTLGLLIIGAYFTRGFWLVRGIQRLYSITTNDGSCDGNRFGYKCGFNDTSGRLLVDCSSLQSDKPLVLLTAGQSNAANFGELEAISTTGLYNYNFYDGKCYQARDPLLGADARGGSVWTRLGRKIIDAGLARQVVLAPVAVGGTAISQWAPGGNLHPRIFTALEGLSAHGLIPNAFLWHQGEMDAGHKTSTENYVKSGTALVNSLRAKNMPAPIFIAKATICMKFPNDAVREAQSRLADELSGVNPGPDTDQLIHWNDRSDFCHFSIAGLERHAELWLEKLRPMLTDRQSGLTTE